LRRARPRAASAIIACLVLLACRALPAMAAAAAANLPMVSADPAQSHDAFDGRPIQRDAPTSLTDSSKTPLPDIHSTGFDPTRVLLALTGVVGLIFLLRWGMRRLLPGAVAHRSTRVMKVLSRTFVSPRQHLLLVQIGKRLVMVGDSGTQLNPLCQIKDPAEVEAILLDLREETSSAARKFDLFFGKARKGFDQDQELNAQELPKDAKDLEIGAANSLDNSDQSESRFDDSHEVVDPSLTQTRNELSGLSEKVRDLARQLGKS
jgi:flagellar biogenesis protein FliO